MSETPGTCGCCGMPVILVYDGPTGHFKPLSEEQRAIIEAVVGGRYLRDDMARGMYIVETLAPLDDDTEPPTPEKVCPTCGGSKDEPIGSYEPTMSGEPVWNACTNSFHGTGTVEGE